MTNIPLPNKINYQKGDVPNSGRLTIEPCYPGYGVMLGNALRRVLLSSLSGGAVTAIKIKGVTHEFSTIPNVEEDVVELILNFKRLRFKMHTDQEVVLKLKVKGEKVVTAGDIEKNSDVEVGNPDLVIANLSGKDASLEVDIYVSLGRGYIPTEERLDENKGVGVINIDSVFTPISNVSLNVENVRVGKMTNYDKLTLGIFTDGTITPESAVQQSAKVLIDHFSLLVGDNNDNEEVEEEKEVKKDKKKK